MDPAKDLISGSGSSTTDDSSKTMSDVENGETPTAATTPDASATVAEEIGLGIDEAVPEKDTHGSVSSAAVAGSKPQNDSDKNGIKIEFDDNVDVDDLSDTSSGKSYNPDVCSDTNFLS